MIGIDSTTGDECTQFRMPTKAEQKGKSMLDTISLIDYHMFADIPSINRHADGSTISNMVGKPKKRYKGALKVR